MLQRRLAMKLPIRTIVLISCGIDRHEIGSCAGATGIEKDKHTAEENQQRAGDREIVRDVATRTTTAG